MIDENRLIEEIKKYHKSLQPRYISKLIDAEIEDIIDIVNEQPKVNEWIPVEERLPEQAGYACLATIENKFNQRKIAKVFTYYGTGTFWICNERDTNLNNWKVIAWMPLLKPYKEKENESI